MAERPDAIVVDHLHKAYRVFASPLERVKRYLGRSVNFLDYEALHDVSFAVRSGESFGIVGENGAGKSTLLKLIAGTTRPTSGTIEVQGVVAAILELGAAFHPEFSGRDNAVLYGALLGIDRAEMARRLDDIVAFAELGPFIDHPIKTYSTGMVMRLGFAVATHVDPEVLIVDEALAVGDGYFQKKCVDTILATKARGTTILFCSHAMYYVTMLCERAVWLREGRVEQIGPAKEVVDAYETYLVSRGKRLQEGGRLAPGPSLGLKVGRIVRVEARSDDGGPAQELRPEQGIVIEVEVESSRDDERYHVGLALDTPDGRCALGVSTLWDERQPLAGRSSYLVRLVVPSLPVASASFHLSGFLLDESGLHVHDQVVLPGAVRVVSPRWTPSLLEVPHRWEGA